MKLTGLSVFFLFFISNATAQLNEQLFAAYDTYQQKSITNRRFKHNDIMAILDKLDKDFAVKQVGRSVEGSPIKLVTYGNGPVNVLMWSQMHGDETTATRAIMDMFIWLKADDQFNDVRKKIKSSLTLHFIPMLNPDGASKFTRRNHFGIDINRDALRLQTPEGRTLKRVRDSLKADWGFNLHDQGRGTSVNGKPATISLLAPPFNVNRDVNETRGDAMQLAKYMFDQIDAYIPNQIGIYPDDFEPRAFGDNMQKWGTRTILIESGGFKDDFEKQEIRKLNFILLLTAIESISGKTFEKTPVDSYHEIPKNSDGRVGELIIHNLNFEGLIRDAAFDRREVDNEDFRKFYAKGYISDLGDLSTSSSYVTFDAKDYEVLPGKIYDKPFATMAELLALDTEALLRQGTTDFIVQSGFDPFTSSFKFNIHSQSPANNKELRIGGNPSLVFAKNGVIEYALINGVLLNLRK